MRRKFNFHSPALRILGLRLAISKSQGPISGSSSLVPCPRVPGTRIPGVRVPGSRVAGSWGPGSQVSGSQVLILDYVQIEIVFIKISFKDSKKAEGIRNYVSK